MHPAFASASILLLPLILGLCCRHVAAAMHDAFHDDRQAEFAQRLRDYDVVFPEKVTATGNFLSHRLSHRSRRSPSDQPDVVHYRLRLRDEDVLLRLEPNHRLTSPGMVVERWGGGPRGVSARLVRRKTGDHCHYRGVVVNGTRSLVTLSACDGLMGYVNVGGKNYFVEPLKGHRNGDDSGRPHLIYERNSLPFRLEASPGTNPGRTGDGPCGWSDSYEEAIKNREMWELRRSKKLDGRKSRRRRSVSMERNVETLVVADKMMVDYYSNEDIETYILTIFNMVTELYRDATIGNAINIALVRLILVEDEEQEEELKVTHHADNSLRSFCKWQKQINPKDDDHPNHHDVAILITRYNICTRMNEPCSTLGLAEVAGMCQPHRSCNINEDSGLALAYTIAHEIGHNFGMNHDGPHNGCEPPFGERQHVMSPHLNADTAPFAWSNCSRVEITKFLDRDWGACLDDEPSDHDFDFPDVPPGVMYDTDHQCRLQNGPLASYCHEIEQDVCTSLWCRQENKCVTRLEPAAPGTHCGPNKWCFNGQCTLMGDRPEAIDGEWGEWSSWSQCSRTCSAGVSQSERHCDNPRPQNGGRYCIGERKKYKLCNPEPCPDDVPSFRAIQCASFNSTPYKGEYRSWVPVSIRATPCQLHCKPDGEFFTVMLADTVEDGTPCNPGTRDMCINGKCRRVACDLGIDSEAQEDRCGVCHGDGTQCQTIRGEFTQKNGAGYVEVVVIPAGSRGIRVEEKAEAPNFIAIKDGNGTYYLNGNLLIQWSGDYDFPGTIIYYRREGELESLHAPGQIKRDMHVMFLFQSSNPGLKYEYTIPNVNASRKPEFHWEYTDWSVCTATCGGGIQTSTAKCMEREAGLVEDTYCNVSKKLPDIQRPCNKHQCPSKWWVGPWQHCSVTCGNNGQRRRAVICVRSFGKDEQIALHDVDCDGREKPAEVELCHHKQPCPGDVFWKTGNWSNTCRGDPCNFQTREVHCSVDDGPCDSSSKPPNRRQCGDIVCGTWVVGNWSECSRSCGQGVQFRRVICEGGLKCLDVTEPLSIQTCDPICESDRDDAKPSSNVTLHVSQTSDSDGTGFGTDPLDTFSGDTVDPEPSDNLSTAATSKPAKDTGVSTTSDPVNHFGDVYVSLDSSSSSGPNDVNVGTKFRSKTVDAKLKTTESASPKDRKRPHRIVIDKVDPIHAKGIEIKFHSKDKYDLIRGDNVSSGSGNSKNESGGSSSMKPAINEEHHLLRHHRKNGSSKDMRPEFEWIVKEWSECSRPCSGGYRQRDVSCYEMTTETLVDHELCNRALKPVEKDFCNGQQCLEWELTEWSACSHTCSNGHKAREVHCPKVDACNPDTKPKHVMPCFIRPCVMWVAGSWSQCSLTCGSGLQVRHVKCIDPSTEETSRGCDVASKPNNRQSCNNEECPASGAAKFSSCMDKLDSALCSSLRHMCNTWYFKVKCCHTCSKHKNDRG